MKKKKPHKTQRVTKNNRRKGAKKSIKFPRGGRVF
jgi:hypothetical protein